MMEARKAHYEVENSFMLKFTHVMEDYAFGAVRRYGFCPAASRISLMIMNRCRASVGDDVKPKCR
jgi:hypothetical protein